MNTYKKNKARIREKAIDWVMYCANNNVFWSELAEASCYFEKQGKRYGLLKEFRTEGVL